MTVLNIKRSNALTGTKSIPTEIVFNQKLTNETIDQLHWMMTTALPDDHINFTWGSNFICGQPLNMKRDENEVDMGRMTFDEYFAKWHETYEPAPSILIGVKK